VSATRTQTRSEDEQPDEAESSGRLIALTSTLGGLGATTLTLMLARALSAQGVRVAVVDADPAGGLGMHLGDRLARGLVWADVPREETSFRAAHLTRALPVWCGCRVLTGDGRGGPESPERLPAVLDALAAEQDVVLVDLPRAWEPPPGADTLLLTGRDLRSAVAAQVRASRLAPRPGTLSLVVRQLGQDLSDTELATFTGCVVLARFPEDRSVRQRAARGDDVTCGRGATRRAARFLASCLRGGSGVEPGWLLDAGPGWGDEDPEDWGLQWEPLGAPGLRDLR